MPALAARPATFAPDPRRRSLLAKVHLAKKEIGLVEDDYRAMLLLVTGKMSAGDCTEAELVKVIEDMKAKGFKPRLAGRTVVVDTSVGGKARTGPAARPADHPSARKARALWISLHQLGAIDNPSEEALEAFATRQLKAERLQWANQGLMFKLVEALKAIAERNGWSQDLTGMSRGGHVRILKLRLCEAILVKLQAAGLAADDWTLQEAGFRLLGLEGPLAPNEVTRMSPMFWDIGKLDLLAQGLGAKLRSVIGQAGRT